jgi:uncharacterized protein (DUF1015 family)
MARIFPFHPYRYTPEAGPLSELVTQPYDKISPEMKARYLALNPHNLVRVILGERYPSDSDSENVYTRAAKFFREWIAGGILKRDAEPSLFVYSQEFCLPDSSEKAIRKGFIGLGAVEEYSEGTVHRHEQTLSGPKKDRMEVLRSTHAHFGQIFMLYPDTQGEVDTVLDEASSGPALATVNDEYGTVHSLWKITDPARIERIQQLMADKKLLIADGHHRYETALAFRNQNPGLPGAGRVMMTFINMHSPGLRILATHRLVKGLAQPLPEGLTKHFRPVGSLEDLKKAWADPHPDKVRIGLAAAGSDTISMYEAQRAEGELDVQVLHRTLLGEWLGIGEEAVRDEHHLKYARGADAAVEAVRRGDAQLAFLLEPVPVDEVARIAFSGGVMPQKSTDFYPKLLSGLTIYKVDE